MPAFRYKASTPEGAVVEGEMGAPDLRTLEELLENEGLWLISAKQKRETPLDAWQRSRIARRDIIELFLQIGTMHQAGMTIISAFESAAEEMRNPYLKEIVEDITRGLRAGIGLSRAMEAYRDTFGHMAVSIIEAGEQAGRLDEVFPYLVDYYEWRDDMNKRLQKASIQPTILIIAILGFITIAFGYIIPSFSKILERLHGDLPLASRIMIATSEFLHEWGWLIAGGAVAAAIAVLVARRKVPAFRLRSDAWLLRLPLLGPILEMVATSRFAHALKAMLDSGIPMIEALETASRTSGNMHIEHAIMRARGWVVAGESGVAEAFRRENIFSPMVRNMIAVGEESGTVERSLGYVAAYFDKEVPRRIDMAMAILEPAMTALLGVFVLLVAMSVFGPIFAIMDSLHR